MMPDWFARPVFHVADVQRAIDFYADKLGFVETWRHEDGQQLLVAQVDRGGCAIIFSRQWPEKIGKGRIFVSLTDGGLQNVEAVRAELERKGAPVRDGEWGYRLFVIDDPDGNQLFFNYPADQGDA